MLNMEVAAELDRVNSEFFTDLDIRRGTSCCWRNKSRTESWWRRKQELDLAEGGSQQTRASS